MTFSKGFQHGIVIGLVSGQLARYAGITGNHMFLFASIMLMFFIMTKWFPMFKNESNMEDLDDE